MMNRREFSVGAACVLGAAALGVPATLLAQVKKPEDGVEYYTLKQRLPAFDGVDNNKIEIIDFFWYNCPHCNAFAPQMAAWMRRMLKEQGIECARRTVAKYREALRIAPANLRKSL